MPPPIVGGTKKDNVYNKTESKIKRNLLCDSRQVLQTSLSPGIDAAGNCVPGTRALSIFPNVDIADYVIYYTIDYDELTLGFSLKSI